MILYGLEDVIIQALTNRLLRIAYYEAFHYTLLPSHSSSNTRILHCKVLHSYHFIKSVSLPTGPVYTFI